MKPKSANGANNLTKPIAGNKSRPAANPVSRNGHALPAKPLAPRPVEKPVPTGPIRIGDLLLADAEAPLPPTKLNDKQLLEFKNLLLHKRSELVRDVTSMADEAIGRKRLEPGSEGAMPIHMAELGSDNWEQELTLGLIANENGVLREIDEALERIENRTYGVCLATHKPISVARLRAKPWAKYCIEYARLREQGRVP